MKNMIDIMSDVAGGCGEIMRSAYSGTIASETKSGFRDLVTKFDTEIQRYAVDALAKAFPGAGFICEESDTGSAAEGDCTFVIDPIDGTANFTHHYGHSCTSIACIVNGKPQAAVIYDPFRDEMFTAEREKGARLNGKPIHVFDGNLAGSMVLFGTAPYNLGLMDETLSRVRSIYGKCQDIRRSGSAALDLCYVAAGRVGLYFELELSLWDFAAGALIAEEAGGVCMTIEGNELCFDRPHKSSIIAGSIGRIRESGLVPAGIPTLFVRGSL